MKKPNMMKQMFVIFQSLFFLVACDFGMMKELDIELLAFSPALSVTAMLNGGNGTFEIRFMETVSLAESYIFKKEIIRNGEIRLYEDGELMLCIPGPFDMSREITSFGDGWRSGQNGYRTTVSGIDTRPGSVYRLEIEVEGYPVAVAASAMPVRPVVSASIDTSVQIVRRNVREIGSAGYWLGNIGNQNWTEGYPDRYWPVLVSVELPDGDDHYCALEIYKTERSIYRNWGYSWGIGASDISILLEDGMDSELLINDNIDLYLFPMLMTRDFRGATRSFYAAVDETSKHLDNDDAPLADDPDFEKITTYHRLYLRVSNITPATYQYYRTLSLQFSDVMLNEQPTIVVGNIENGYGSFAVYNATYVTLLLWETHEYRPLDSLDQ